MDDDETAWRETLRTAQKRHAMEGWSLAMRMARQARRQFERRPRPRWGPDLLTAGARAAAAAWLVEAARHRAVYAAACRSDYQEEIPF